MYLAIYLSRCSLALYILLKNIKGDLLCYNVKD